VNSQLRELRMLADWVAGGRVDVTHCTTYVLPDGNQVFFMSYKDRLGGGKRAWEQQAEQRPSAAEGRVEARAALQGTTWPEPTTEGRGPATAAGGSRGAGPGPRTEEERALVRAVNAAIQLSTAVNDFIRGQGKGDKG
jgi:hypothetical protein